jgi:hypothetical protein
MWLSEPHLLKCGRWTIGDGKEESRRKFERMNRILKMFLNIMVG